MRLGWGGSGDGNDVGGVRQRAESCTVLPSNSP